MYLIFVFPNSEINYFLLELFYHRARYHRFYETYCDDLLREIKDRSTRYWNMWMLIASISISKDHYMNYSNDLNNSRELQCERVPRNKTKFD